MIHIQITEKYLGKFSQEVILDLIKDSLAYLEKNNHTLSLVIDDNAGIQILNRDYRHIDAPTDVLSFVYDTVDL